MDDAGLVSEDCYGKGSGKRLLFLDKPQAFTATREHFLEMDSSTPINRTKRTSVVSSWNCSNTLNSDHTLSKFDKYKILWTPNGSRFEDSVNLSVKREALFGEETSVPDWFISHSRQSNTENLRSKQVLKNRDEGQGRSKDLQSNGVVGVPLVLTTKIIQFHVWRSCANFLIC